MYSVMSTGFNFCTRLVGLMYYVMLTGFDFYTRIVGLGVFCYVR